MAWKLGLILRDRDTKRQIKRDAEKQRCKEIGLQRERNIHIKTDTGPKETESLRHIGKER